MKRFTIVYFEHGDRHFDTMKAEKAEDVIEYYRIAHPTAEIVDLDIMPESRIDWDEFKKMGQS